jgi:hypothetical protein
MLAHATNFIFIFVFIVWLGMHGVAPKQHGHMERVEKCDVGTPE